MTATTEPKLTVAPEFLVRRKGEAFPYGSTTWTLQARDARDYAAARWDADQFEVVTRAVTEYVVVPDGVSADATATPFNPAQGEYVRGLRDARATLIGSDRNAAESGRPPQYDKNVPEPLRAALTALDRLIDSAAKAGKDIP